MNAKPDYSFFSIFDSDPDFPTALQQAHPSVSRLFGSGCEAFARELLRRPGVAIVGSRQATAQGCADANWFARELSQAGLTIISGLAQGIDAAAHRGGLGGPGKTAAVLGNGLDRIYPRHHAGLAQEIQQQGGCLITEYPDGSPARPQHFPNRNRIIAGLSRAVLVVEALPQSGSLITARHALDLGVDVYAIPGSIHMPQSAGCNQLIRQGAQPVQSPEQLMEDLGLIRTVSQTKMGRSQTGTDPVNQRLLGLLNAHPQDVGDLGRLVGQATTNLYGDLLLLELMGLAYRTPDGKWLKLALL